MDGQSGTATRAAVEEARAALEQVDDPTARATVWALLAAVRLLDEIAQATKGLDARVEQLNQYLGAIANKP
ncbi:hypothetical protein [Streptomyces sp. URMC 123]|uniref:hypothetical protein n=1 Tax=Streptomyces sp. URMC 123 TaxID=3423403 RepID=UPI003F19D6AC